ncbi:conjugal transfer protein [Lactonifactor longoviformis]|uniref:Antirestriction protein (ArdA) n=1 Tax=Lactonifactor longoviformis DSM 17459 TaxID=1122155 RepID=A0A1M5CTK3_9CLOT|nr:antirestriction protein ArdA [Lactonifactor longoviformis]POP33189.1 conjugal transfer protein [Lactonifactor longoviformis]SHF58051.1 Antirestriction protein (ArdA) [Lactonifactor longoviformis DSM 17459]
MEELRVLIEATIPTDGELPSAWFDLPIDEIEFEERLKVSTDSEDYCIVEMELPFADEVKENTIVGQLNDLYRMYEDLPVDHREELEELLTHFTSLEELYQHRYDIIHYANCNTMIDVARHVLADNPAFNSLSEDCVRYFDFEAYGQSLDENGKFIES